MRRFVQQAGAENVLVINCGSSSIKFQVGKLTLLVPIYRVVISAPGCGPGGREVLAGWAGGQAQLSTGEAQVEISRRNNS